MLRAATLMILATLLGCTLANAQHCRGLPSFVDRPVQLFAGGLFSDDAMSYKGGVALGSAGAFGTLALGRIDSTSSHSFGAEAGYQMRLNKRGTAQWCPVAGVQIARSPWDIDGTRMDYHETDLSFGLQAGVSATHSDALEIVPTGSVAFEGAGHSLTGASGTVSSSTWFGVAGLGVGFVLGRAMSVTPSVSHAFGVRGASTRLDVTFAFKLGGAPARPNLATSCAGLASEDSIVYDTTQVAERPSLRVAPKPGYPPLEREAGIHGRVIVTVIIGADGTPDATSMRIVQHVDAAIDYEAVRWLRNVSYWPACRDGHPVRVRIAQPVDF
jgi:TonB family protein